MRKLKRLLSVLLLLVVSSFLYIHALSISDLKENLNLSLNQLQVAKTQLMNLETELDNKNLALQSLNQSLLDSQNLLTAQSTSITSLKSQNQTLMDTQVLLQEQLTTSQEQLNSLSKELKRKVSVNSTIWCVIGVTIGASVTYLIMRSLK